MGYSQLEFTSTLSASCFYWWLSTGIYIFLGNRLRAAGHDPVVRSRISPKDTRATEIANSNQSDSLEDNIKPQTPLNLNVIPIPDEDLNAIRGIFGIDTFFATETIPYQEGVIFKGNMRGEPQAVHERLTTNLQQLLSDRYRLFSVENPEGKPVIIVLPSRNDPPTTTLPQKILAVSLLVVTIATSLETGGLLLGFDFFANSSRFSESLPIAAGILAVLTAHEIGHRLLAQRHQIRLSLPFFSRLYKLALSVQSPALSLCCPPAKCCSILPQPDQRLGALSLC